MLTIRREQIRVFDQEAVKRFQEGLIPHLNEHFPAYVKYLGGQGIRRVIELGCRNATHHGFDTDRDLCLYTDLSIMLGAGFDTDPQLPWAGSILRDPGLRDPWDRMDKLWDTAMEYLVRVCGPDDVFPEKTYRLAIRQLPLKGPAFAPESMVNAVSRFLEEIWPEKAEDIGSPGLIRSVGRSLAEAGRFGITHPGGKADFAVFAFLLGHHFFRDPVFPMAQNILDDSVNQGFLHLSGEEKSGRLQRELEKWLDQLYFG